MSVPYVCNFEGPRDNLDILPVRNIVWAEKHSSNIFVIHVVCLETSLFNWDADFLPLDCMQY
jgi:hypothetical protein